MPKILNRNMVTLNWIQNELESIGLKVSKHTIVRMMILDAKSSETFEVGDIKYYPGKWVILKEDTNSIDSNTANAALAYSKILQQKVKKMKIDLSWDNNNLGLVLDTITECNHVPHRTEIKFETDCPNCGRYRSAGWAIMERTRKPAMFCPRCMIQMDIWEYIMLIENLKFKNTVSFVYEQLFSEKKFGAYNHDLDLSAKKNIKYGKELATRIYNEAIDYTPETNEESLIRIYRAAGIKYLNRDASVYKWGGRIIYPFYGNDGEIIGAKGRLNDIYWSNVCGEEKTLNTIGLQKSNLLYGASLFDWDPEKPLFVVEGEKDALKALAAGHQAVATLGSSLSKNQVNIIEKKVGKEIEVVIAYDDDEAGDVGSIKAWGLLKACGFTSIYKAIMPNKRNDFGDCDVKELLEVEYLPFDQIDCPVYERARIAYENVMFEIEHSLSAEHTNGKPVSLCRDDLTPDELLSLINNNGQNHKENIFYDLNRKYKELIDYESCDCFIQIKYDHEFYGKRISYDEARNLAEIMAQKTVLKWFDEDEIEILRQGIRLYSA
ncbi:MAG: toprim domain-containing protein [Acidaminobacter sp.]|uniref:toprim domain-containing protein n=1 Tax=Acidaminobacter sp. TaxID=1872102 RepID=UPI001384C7CA|nr:toprim domain-containing protein [Acidaminobacter sp.]MZQ99547.1 toprim domain-containing protein [Acidaminobacter sp.]